MLRKELIQNLIVPCRRPKRRKISKVNLRRKTAFIMAGILSISSVMLPMGTNVFAGESDAKILAFATAEGGGRFASGGRGYDVYTVTTLEDYKMGETPIPGSLRYGIEEEAKNNGGTIIVFNIGGTIQLKQTLSFGNRKNITIAGQTAPGDGITLSGYETNISDSENLIIRYVRFRTGAANVHSGGDSMDALWGRDNKTFIIDHCSFSWNTDETLSTYRGVDGTVQWCIISESLTVSGHSKGRHGYGGIFGGDNVVFQYNLMANHTSRNPRLGGGFMGDPTKQETPNMARVQISNSVLYNWGYNTCYGGGYTYSNYINNYLKAGLGTRDTVKNQVIDAGESTKKGGFYVSGNVLEGNTKVSADNSLGIKMSGATSGANKTEIVQAPYQADGFEHITLVSAQDCYQPVLDRAGATYPYRDAIDARIVSETVNNTGRYINTEDEVGGYPARTVERAADFDTDQDGIPDEWETAHGLNPDDASDSKKINPVTGYAYVEDYFNGLVEEVEKPDYKASNPSVSIDLADNSQFTVGKDVKVTAQAAANHSGTIEKVEFYNGTQLVSTDTEAPYECTYSGLADGTYNITARAYDNKGNQTQSSVSKLHMNSTASAGEWTSLDIGMPGIAGSASMTDGVLTVKGAGKLGKSEGSVSGGSWSDTKTDNFQYTYMPVSGDAEIITRLDSATTVDNHVFTGVMFRESLTPGSKTAALGMSLVKISNETTWSTYLVGRNTTSGSINNISETIDSPSNAQKAGIPLLADIRFKDGAQFNGTWFKLVRRGNTFTGYSSADGVSWTKVGSKNIDMGQDIYVGFAVDANKAANQLNNLSTAKFSNIKINDEFVDVTYELKNITTSGVDYALPGTDFTTQLEAKTGYHLPDGIVVTAGGSVLTEQDYTYDAATGMIRINASKISLSSPVAIKAAGISDSGTESDYIYSVYGDTQDITITEQDGVMNIRQTAAGSSMVKQKGTAGNKVSYVLFPDSDGASRMVLKLKVNSFAEGKSSGVYVGAFQTEGDYLYNSIALRGTGDSNAVSPYWIKKNLTTPSKDGVAGNGSPKLSWNEGAVYDITVQKKSGQYVISVKEEGSGAGGEKTFTSAETYLTAEMAAQLGIAINSTDVTIQDWMVYDTDGNILFDQNNQETPYRPEASGSDLMGVSAQGSVVRVNQRAQEGQFTQEQGSAGVNVSYLLLPDTKAVNSMTLTMKVNSYSITGSDGKYTGVAVGAFQTSGNMAFASLGFRGYDQSVGTDALSPYWLKSSGKTGNGSPKFNVLTNNRYQITFTRTGNGYTAELTSLDEPLSVDVNGNKTYTAKKDFKWSEMNLTADSAVQFGLALVGADVDILSWAASDASGNIVYDQKDFYKDAGTAPTVTAVNPPVVSEDRTSVNITWSGEGATLDGKYLVAVSSDGGKTFKELERTAQTDYTYQPKNSGSYIFRITGVCGDTVTNSMTSAAVTFTVPMKAPVIDAVSGDNKNTITWKAVNEAKSYKIYRSVTRSEGYTEIGTTEALSYTDTTAENEVPYFYTVAAVGENNTSNPSEPVSIMATKGHTGEYSFGAQAASMTVLDQSNETVTEGNAFIQFSYDQKGTVKITKEGTEVLTKQVKAGEAVNAQIALSDGRNAVRVTFTGVDGKKTCKDFNFVKLTQYDIVVDAASTGSSTERSVPIYQTVAEAVASVPADNQKPVVIFIKNGTYYEKLLITTPNITFIGEDSHKTILCFDAAAGKTDPSTGGTYGTSGSASVTIESTASGIGMENLTIANTFDYPNENIDGKQAVALLVKADEAIFTNVRMTGWQDTLCADGNARQYYQNCYIEGNVDFIFGNAQAVFEQCDIVSNGGGYVTAASTDSNKSTGYVFIDSRILKKDSSVADRSVALGRPWRANACVTYVNCYLDSHIRTEGYTNMSDNSYKAAQFYEYQSYGPGFAVNTDRRQLSEQQGRLMTVNGVFAREAGEGFTYKEVWDALTAYADMEQLYIKTKAPVDFKALDDAIAAAEALKAEDYKDFSAVTAALNAAKALERDTAGQETVAELAGSIMDAISRLQKTEGPTVPDEPEVPTIPGEPEVPTVPEEPVIPETPSDPDEESEGGVQTGDANHAVPYVFGGLLSLLLLGYGKSKRKKDQA